MQEPGDGRAIAGLRGFLTGNLGRVFERLWKDGRIAQRQDLGARFVERIEDRGDRALGVDDDGLALELRECGLESIALVEPDAVSKMLAHLGPDLLAATNRSAVPSACTSA